MNQLPRHVTTEDLSAYLDGWVREDERTAIASHLAGCAACRAELAELRAAVSLLGAIPVIAPPRSFRLDVARAPAPAPIVRLLPVVRALSIAAVIVFLVASGALYFGNAESSGGGSVMSSETGTLDDASQEAGTTGTEATGDGRLIDRGAAASGGNDPLDDLTTLQEAPEGVASQAAADVAGSGGTIDRLTADYGVAVVTSLGALAIVLVVAWIMLSRMRRRVRPA